MVNNMIVGGNCAPPPPPPEQWSLSTCLKRPFVAQPFFYDADPTKVIQKFILLGAKHDYKLVSCGEILKLEKRSLVLRILQAVWMFFGGHSFKPHYNPEERQFIRQAIAKYRDDNPVSDATLQEIVEATNILLPPRQEKAAEPEIAPQTEELPFAERLMLRVKTTYESPEDSVLLFKKMKAERQELERARESVEKSRESLTEEYNNLISEKILGTIHLTKYNYFDLTSAIEQELEKSDLDIELLQDKIKILGETIEKAFSFYEELCEELQHPLYRDTSEADLRAIKTRAMTLFVQTDDTEALLNLPHNKRR